MNKAGFLPVAQERTQSVTTPLGVAYLHASRVQDVCDEKEVK